MEKHSISVLGADKKQYEIADFVWIILMLLALS